MSRVSELSDYAKRKAALTRKAALDPEVSLHRFRESFQNSGASAAVKAKFARLFKSPGNVSSSTVDDTLHSNPSLPASNVSRADGIMHE